MSKQTEIPMEGSGVERPQIKALDEAIETWRDLVARRMKLNEKEVEARSAVSALMKKHNLETYVYDDDHKCVIKEGVKVEKIKHADSGADEE